MANNGVVIRVAEGCAEDVNVLWDSVWDDIRGFADWANADPDESSNVGGLRAKAAIETAVTLCMFTDKRITPDHELFYLADGDTRGYWGDGVDVRTDLNETEMGSYLWLLERAPLTIRGLPIARWAEVFANDALATLIAQGVCVRIDVAATAYPLEQRLNLNVALYGRDGSQIYNRNFDVLWQQVAR
jgi:phage gp46-like protein